jgi:hypothetical protein
MVELPGVYGLEHERRLIADPGGHMSDPAVLSEIVRTNDICDATKAGGFSVLNGGKHYVDSYRPDEYAAIVGNNAAYETATPETTSLRELRRYSRAMDLEAIRAVQTYLQGQSDVTAIRYNHRSSIGRDNAYSSQLNYGVSQPTAWDFRYEQEYQAPYFAHSIVHAAAILGGGAVHGMDISLSQKADGLVEVRGRLGNRGTVYDLPQKIGESSTLRRVELRLVDSQPGEWASYVQAGLGAMALSVAQLPQAELERIFGDPMPNDALVRYAKEQNKVQVDAEGILYAPSTFINNVDQTIRLAETFLGLPRQYVHGEEDLTMAAYQTIAACDLVKRALAKQTSIHGPAAYGVGWARRAAHALAATSQRGMIDFSRPECAAADAAYDLVRIEPDNVTYGPAFILDNLPARWRLSEQEIADAMTSPPADTVAAYRVNILQEHRPNVRAMNWSRVEVWRPDGSLEIMFTANPLNPIDGTF